MNFLQAINTDNIARSFLLQAILIFFSALAGIVLTFLIINNVLMRKAIALEADYFWNKYEIDAQTPLPMTKNLHGYIFDINDKSILNSFKELPSISKGYYSLTENTHFNSAFISEKYDQRLLLLFNKASVDSLIALYGLIPLAVVLIPLYLIIWLSYMRSKRALSPYRQLTRKVNRLDPENLPEEEIEFPEFNNIQDTDVHLLSSSLSALIKRLQDFTEREKTFTRDVSHELRSPLTVISMATSMILADGNISNMVSVSTDRIKRASQDMEELISVLLTLSREQNSALAYESINLENLVKHEMHRVQHLIEKKPVSINLHCKNKCNIFASGRAVKVILGNLIRNACLYTDTGLISIHIFDGKVSISDTGKGIHEDQLEHLYDSFFRGKNTERSSSKGYGIGLAIVKRLVQQFGWSIEIKSKINIGTEVIVDFSLSLEKESTD